MNFFERELRKVFGDGTAMDSPTFSGGVCFGTLGEDLRVRAQFISTHVSSQYDALKLTVMNRTGGPVDALVLNLRDLWGRKPVPGNPNFPDGVSPHIWAVDTEVSWYAFQPTRADYQSLRQAAAQYLDVYRDRRAERGGPKLVYICAPLRGDVEKNIAFATEKAREVFKSGDIPVCPHLMFPPIAQVGDTAEDRIGREMGLRLVESCQRVHVYGPVWTEGMWAEINRAQELGIPVVTDQKTLARSPGRAVNRQARKQR